MQCSKVSKLRKALEKAEADQLRADRRSKQRSNQKLIGKCFKRVIGSGGETPYFEFTLITGTRLGKTYGQSVLDSPTGLTMVWRSKVIDLNEVWCNGMKWEEISPSHYRKEVGKVRSLVIDPIFGEVRLRRSSQ